MIQVRVSFMGFFLLQLSIISLHLMKYECSYKDCNDTRVRVSIFVFPTMLLKWIPARTPCGNFQRTFGYLILRPCALFATVISQYSFWIYKIQGFNWPMHTLHDSVIHLHFSWYENNDISSELSEIKLRPSSMHTLHTFTALLAGILRDRNN